MKLTEVNLQKAKRAPQLRLGAFDTLVELFEQLEFTKVSTQKHERVFSGQALKTITTHFKKRGDLKELRTLVRNQTRKVSDILNALTTAHHPIHESPNVHDPTTYYQQMIELLDGDHNAVPTYLLYMSDDRKLHLGSLHDDEIETPEHEPFVNMKISVVYDWKPE